MINFFKTKITNQKSIILTNFNNQNLPFKEEIKNYKIKV